MAGWDRGGRRRFVVLAVVRVVVQCLSLAWFLAAARLMSDPEFGLVSAGLAFCAVFQGLGDLGMIRTVVRHIAADDRLLWSVYRSAVRLRIAGGSAVAVATWLVISALPVDIPGSIVAAAGLVALMSGTTEIAYAALRSIASITTEASLLVAERTAFLILGVLLVSRGGSALSVLLLYAATNAVSAGVAALVVWRQRRPAPGGVTMRLLDREAWYTAAAFALVTVSPRVGAILLALLASANDVAVYAVAQRPVESITLFTLSTAAPLLPIVRSHVSRGLRERANTAALSVLGALSVCLAPVLCWFIVDAPTVVASLFGADRYAGADVALRLLAVVILTWSWRGVAEALLLGEQRAGVLFIITAAGTATAALLGAPLVLARSSTGAAQAVLLSEVVMTLLLVWQLSSLRKLRSLWFFVPMTVSAVGSTSILSLTAGSVIWSLLAVGASTAAGVVVALTMIKGLEFSS